MEIRLQNIGLVKDSTIRLDGLTVITGHNNSGKTTVGKVVYSLFDATSNIEQKAENDKANYISESLRDVARILRNYRDIVEGIRHLFGGHSALKQVLLAPHYRSRQLNIDPEDFAKKLLDELEALDFDRLSAFTPAEDPGTLLTNDAERGISSKLEKSTQEAIDFLRQLLEKLKLGENLNNYTRECLNLTLRSEFSSQIQPVNGSAGKSQITATDSDSTLFDFEIVDENIDATNPSICSRSPFENTFLIDDPFVIDPVAGRIPSYFAQRYAPDWDPEQASSLLNANRIFTHSQKLINILQRDKSLPPTVLEEVIKKESIAPIINQINQAIPGDFEYKRDGLVYLQQGKELKISNLATGSKMFAVIKLLLQKGYINDSTMLILDEPESHLHPKWQNLFAEMVVLLVKDTGVNVLLTTHSSNFMLAIDAFMRKHQIHSQTNFYQTKPTGDGCVEYRCVNETVSEIYADFMEALAQVKILRDKYLPGGDE